MIDRTAGLILDPAAQDRRRNVHGAVLCKTCAIVAREGAAINASGTISRPVRLQERYEECQPCLKTCHTLES
jgi:hypothetical protein